MIPEAHLRVLDVKGTHRGNPGCPMRIMDVGGGSWVCVDCGSWIKYVPHLRQRFAGRR